ncbi:zinc-binding alcohol dehydrogenase family protein [Aspergillus thermomutatus]|uniref:Enoyl reductase (ER) domain-containing protein n=1 Tax=Aspergillus thermomutatus TaxID=41047 RepID=A0A397H4F6_ASPTH|nr:uncharacterized protein CDV56_105642 [Aspergillus thermomutatus]RHZ56273.1 hypothetical protein CDV56_105642 [Aspergillus thermomutatus]
MSTTIANAALYVDENLRFGVRRREPIPSTVDGELLIETIYSGANPADIKHATLLGIDPAVLGYDFCGRVFSAPQGSKFKPGEIVAGYTPAGIGRPTRYGTHQRYLACPEEMCFRVPASLPPSHAACLPVVAMTAADALYNIFELPVPNDSSSNAGTSFGPILIWGASSSVGICAVQFAKASGIAPIIVTASPGRHSLLKELGATHTLDYKSPNVAGEIREILEKTQCNEIQYGFDAVGSPQGKGSAQLMAECVSKEATLVSVVVQEDPRFKMPLATPNLSVTVRPAGAPGSITIPARPADYERAWEAFQWAIKNYGICFRLPAVEVFQGTAEEALEEVKALADGGRGFGKLVLEHPLL